MLNTFMIYKENIMIVNDIEKISKEKKNLGEDFEVIK